MATDYKALGKRISNARKQAGITQEALGEQLNMTRKHISVIESAMELVQLICHLQRDPVVFHIPLHRAPTLILRADTGNELIVPALHKSILAHPGEPLAEVTPNLHLVVQVSRPDHRRNHIKIHKKHAHCIVLLNCFCRPIQNHV